LYIHLPFQPPKDASKSTKSAKSKGKSTPKTSTMTLTKTAPPAPALDPFLFNLQLLSSVLQSASASFAASSSHAASTTSAPSVAPLSWSLVPVVLDTLGGLLGALPPLALRSMSAQPKTQAVLTSVGAFLVSVAIQASSHEFDLKLKALQFLLRLVVQSGSLQMVLHACEALIAFAPRLTPEHECELAALLKPLAALSADLQLNGYLHERSIDFLGFFKFVYPNAEKPAVAAKPKPKPKPQRDRFGNRRRNRYGRYEVRSGRVLLSVGHCMRV
jgi:hypothetical protein